MPGEHSSRLSEVDDYTIPPIGSRSGVIDPERRTTSDKRNLVSHIYPPALDRKPGIDLPPIDSKGPSPIIQYLSEAP